MTDERITSGQRKQIGRLVEDSIGQKVVAEILDELDPSKDAAQRVVEGGDELAQEMKKALRAVITRLAMPQDFADEEASSSYGYFSGYRKPKSVVEQVAILRRLFPELGEVTADETIATAEMPQGAKGYFVIPRWQLFGATYNEAVEKVLAKLAETRHFYNYRQGQLGPKYLCEGAKKAAAFKRLGEEQTNHQLLVFAGQFGVRYPQEDGTHIVSSVRRAGAKMNSSEFGLGAYETAIMLLVHPERLHHYDDLWIDCAGDEYCPEAVGRPACAPVFNFHGGRLGFCTRFVGDVYGDYGSSSGFSSVPQ